MSATTYAALMQTDTPHIVLTIDTKEPIELGDFVSAFTSIANQYKKFILAEHPGLNAEAQMFVREVRPGSIIADLIPLGIISLPAVVQYMDRILIVEQFVKLYGNRLLTYVKGGRVEAASKSDLKDFMGAVVAIANDPKGNGSIEAVSFEDGKRQVRAVVKFKTADARRATKEIEYHRQALESVETADYKRVLMTFRQSNVKDLALGKRTGERVVIEDISERELSLIYASELAEQRIKHEIREADENVYKKGFVVDVNVQTKGGKAIAYRITNLHQVIDLPQDDE